MKKYLTLLLVLAMLSVGSTVAYATDPGDDIQPEDVGDASVYPMSDPGDDIQPK